MTTLRLPTADREILEYRLSEPLSADTHKSGSAFNRIAYAAAHVVADPMATCDPWLEPAIDWEATLAYRDYLFDLGFGVAEAMDTAQRGMGLGWEHAQELIRRSLASAKTRPGATIACGAGTDHLADEVPASIDAVLEAYEEQCNFVETLDGRIILMASRALARAANGPDDYARVYDRILTQTRQPVIIHWLGEMFDPALAGYWGSNDHDEAMSTALDIICDHADKVDGIKISLLSKEKEISMRARLPAGVRMYTGDDFNYAELIAGDDSGSSDALLGIFDTIAPAASAALGALACGDRNEFFRILEPTVPLSRHIFQAPTRFYKTGVVFAAYLNGHQDHFTMIGGQESARSTLHLAELFRLADKSGIFRDPEMAADRMRKFLAVRGIA